MKFAAVNQANFIFLLDHLAPVCEMFDAPLFVFEEKEFAYAKKCYPFINSVKINTEDYVGLLKNNTYDALFYALARNKVDADQIKAIHNIPINQSRSIFMPHGNSDKGHHSQFITSFALQDISLVYGNKMIDFFKQLNIYDDIKRYIVIGNLRYKLFLKHKTFFLKLVKDEILSKFNPNLKTIIYAPTWKDVEQSSSFENVVHQLIESLKNKYNLIIKLHPALDVDHPGLILNLKYKYENYKNIKFLKNFPLIYPILYYSDIYIGDYSSVGYDFLTFNRPMFFFQLHKGKKFENKNYLQNCGAKISIKDAPFLNKIIPLELKKDKQYQSIREKTYEYTFNQKVTEEEIKRNIISMCQT